MDPIAQTILSGRRAWSMSDLRRQHPTIRLDRILTALATMVDSGVLIRSVAQTAEGSKAYWRPGTVKPQAFADGVPRRVTVTPEVVAPIIAALPAKAESLSSRFAMPVHTVRVALHKGLAVYVDGLWYAPGKAPGAPSRGHAEAHGDDRDPGSSMQAVVTLVPSTEGFDCQRKGMFVTFHACHDGYMDANSGFRKVQGPCFKCPKGADHRAAMAAGA